MAPQSSYLLSALYFLSIKLCVNLNTCRHRMNRTRSAHHRSIAAHRRPGARCKSKTGRHNQETHSDATGDDTRSSGRCQVRSAAMPRVVRYRSHTTYATMTEVRRPPPTCIAIVCVTSICDNANGVGPETRPGPTRAATSMSLFCIAAERASDRPSMCSDISFTEIRSAEPYKTHRQFMLLT